MTTIQIGELPPQALLKQYALQGAYTDCYFMDVPGSVTFSDYVETFYTTSVFKVERAILALFARKPSNDQEARQLASGQAAKFAAWTVEGRTVNQLLLCDFLGRTRSWLMSAAVEEGGASFTRLYFGSAFLHTSRSEQGKASFGFAFHALSGFHRLYTRTLMRAALTQLSRCNGRDNRWNAP